MYKAQEPLVSICCITYNHEKYIRESIESFLMQETDFPLEIIIHDDASTDMTADIIREYEKKYPKIIKPIYQTENQYSKGEKVTLLACKEAKGKYIALCEGDDYWTDQLKLQNQIMEMEKHPECHISFHPAVIKWDNGSRDDQILGLHYKKNKIFKIEEVILGGGDFMPTNSIMINKLAMPKIASFFEIPKDIPTGDYYIQILGAENGGALYLHDVMSVYRRGVSGSWHERFEKSSEIISWLETSIAATNKINAFTNNKYSKQFAMRKKYLVLIGLSSTRIEINTRKNILKSYIEYISFKDKLLWNARLNHPKIMKALRDLIYK